MRSSSSVRLPMFQLKVTLPLLIVILAQPLAPLRFPFSSKLPESPTDSPPPVLSTVIGAQSNTSITVSPEIVILPDAPSEPSPLPSDPRLLISPCKVTSLASKVISPPRSEERRVGKEYRG